MGTTKRQGKSNPLHYILASDRMIRQGYSVEAINAYVRETPFEALVQGNLDALEARFAAMEDADSEEARERRELALSYYAEGLLPASNRRFVYPVIR